MIGEPLLLSIVMVAVFALTWGGVTLIRRGRDRPKGVLMLVAAIVLFGNVLVWAWPVPHAAPTMRHDR